MCSSDLATNPPDVVAVIERLAGERGAAPLLPARRMPQSRLGWRTWNTFCKNLLYRKSHRANIACAWEAVRIVLADLGLDTPRKTLLAAVLAARWPGRMQHVSLVNLLGKDKKILVDGAHNELGGESLGYFVDKVVRIDPKTLYRVLPVTWVLAASKAKDATAILRHLLKNGDRVVTVEFGPVDGMAFVEPMSSDKLADIAQEVVASKGGMAEVKSFGSDVEGALKHAVDVAGEHPVVVAGSLYLISDVFRLLKTANAKPGAVPVEDIWTSEVGSGREAKKPKGKRASERPVGRRSSSKNKENSEG